MAAGLAGLTVATSWVVSSISVWLVPVYIGAMFLIFAAPRTNRPTPARGDDAGESSPSEVPLAPPSVEGKAEEQVDDPAPAAAPPKPRKRKVKAKKTAQAAAGSETTAAPGEVVWVRVGPGKFVRSVVPAADPAAAPAAEQEREPAPNPEEEPRQDVSMDQDDQPGRDEAPRGPEPSGAAEAIAEEHGNAPSTLGEVEEIVPDPEAGQDEESPSAAMEVSGSGRPVRLGSFFSASLRRPRRMVEPAAALFSRRLANVRRSGETRVRQFAEAVRGRRVNVQRDFHPRSPPARA